jgi:hypothetical protein
MIRKLRREQKKVGYDKFKRVWSDEKRYQSYLVEHSDGKIITDDDGNKKLTGPNGENAPLLGKRPTFRMWASAIGSQPVVRTTQAEKKVDVDDLSWDEGG